MTAPIRSRKHALSPYVAALTALALPLIVQPLTARAEGTDAEDHRPHDDKPTEVTVKGQRTTYRAESANRKATTSVLDAPQTVQVITEEIITEQGATNLTEALRNSPGVGTFYLGENGTTSTGDAVFLRGSDASGSIFADGIRDIASVSRDTFNIQQIEVLKGAAGADIGRGAATGAINLITKRPMLKDAYSGSLGLGEGDYARGTVDLNWKLSDRSALRVNLMDQDAGVNGRDSVKNKRWGIAPTIAFGLHTPTEIYLGYMHVEQDNIPDDGVFTIGLPGYSSPDPVNRPYLSTAARVDSATWYGTKDDHDTITSDVLSAIVEHDFNDRLSLSNTTRWSETDQEYQLSSFTAPTANLKTPNASDPATWTILRNINNKNAVNKTLTNQTNLRAQFRTGALEHTVSTGLEFISEEQLSRLYAASATTYPAMSIYKPNPDVSGYMRALSGAYNKGKTVTTGVYVNDSIHFGPQWLLTAGLRLDHYKTDYDVVSAAGVHAPLSTEDDIISGRLGLDYKPTHDSSLYASYAVTNQPPGGANFSLVSTVGATNPDADPQEARTSEIGGKWGLMHNHLLLTGALYRTAYSDTVAQDTDGSYYHTGEKSVQGVEIGAVGQISKAWSLSTGYTTMKTKTILAPVAADGSQLLAYNPSDALTLWTTYVLRNGLTFGGGATYNGEMKRGTDGAIGTPKLVKSYLIYNGLAKYRINQTCATA